MKSKFVVEVLNCPKDVSGNYIVARLDDARLWFYGAYSEEDRALRAAVDIGNGVVLRHVRDRNPAFGGKA